MSVSLCLLIGFIRTQRAGAADPACEMCTRPASARTPTSPNRRSAGKAYPDCGRLHVRARVAPGPQGHGSVVSCLYVRCHETFPARPAGPAGHRPAGRQVRESGTPTQSGSLTVVSPREYGDAQSPEPCPSSRQPFSTEVPRECGRRCPMAAVSIIEDNALVANCVHLPLVRAAPADITITQLFKPVQC